MNKTFLYAFAFSVCLLFACSNTPEEYFDQTVLNTNMLTGFADAGLYNELLQTGVKLNAATNKTEPMKRSETIADKIAFAQQSLDKIKGLHPTDETREMINTSTALYEFVLPVYKNNYIKLAALFDGGAPKEQTDAAAEAISKQYHSKFEELYGKVIALGKPYAAKHNIKVDWGQ